MNRPACTHRLHLVPTASHAIKGEKALLEAGIPCKLIPVPRTISSQCGVCLRVEIGLCDRAGVVLERADVQISGTHDL